MMSRPAGRGQPRWYRRLAARLAGQPPAVTDSVLRPGEVLVFDGASPSFRAMSTGQPVRSDHLGQETVDRLTRRPGGHQIAAGYTTFPAVPLAARGLVLGSATFARAPRGPGFEPDDIVLGAELAARAAVCIDNARLYDRERRTAFALQHGLLPREPRIPAGMEVAHRYFPVGASVVGGDWHDIVRLPGGRAALVVGDAMGHGPEAAAVMVQLPTAAHRPGRAPQVLDLPPGLPLPAQRTRPGEPAPGEPGPAGSPASQLSRVARRPAPGSPAPPTDCRPGPRRT
jgi:Stage II sporulation protein E (SpoIIE)